jgi:glycine cleavage system aminomethyltransferase T
VFGDLTVTRLAADRYLMIGSPTAIVYYQRWFDRHRGADDVTIRDVTADWTGFSLTGPKARDVLAALVTEDISNQAFPFLSARRVKVGLADAIVIRVSFTGELGYEIYTAPEFQLHVLERISRGGPITRPQALRHARAQCLAPGKRLRLLGPRIQRRLHAGGGRPRPFRAARQGRLHRA